MALSHWAEFSWVEAKGRESPELAVVREHISSSVCPILVLHLPS